MSTFNALYQTEAEFDASYGPLDYAEEAAAAGVRATSYKVVPDGSVLATLARLLDSGAIRVFVDRVFDLSEAAAAHRELEKGHTRGKIVLAVGES